MRCRNVDGLTPEVVLSDTTIVDVDRRKLTKEDLDRELMFLNADAKRDPNLARDVLYLLYRASWRKRK